MSRLIWKRNSFCPLEINAEYYLAINIDALHVEALVEVELSQWLHTNSHNIIHRKLTIIIRYYRNIRIQFEMINICKKKEKIWSRPLFSILHSRLTNKQYILNLIIEL